MQYSYNPVTGQFDSDPAGKYTKDMINKPYPIATKGYDFPAERVSKDYDADTPFDDKGWREIQVLATPSFAGVQIDFYPRFSNIGDGDGKDMHFLAAPPQTLFSTTATLQAAISQMTFLDWDEDLDSHQEYVSGRLNLGGVRGPALSFKIAANQIGNSSVPLRICEAQLEFAGIGG